jgi:hypothetical protein
MLWVILLGLVVSWIAVDNCRSANRIHKENNPMNMFRKFTFLTILLILLASLALPRIAYASAASELKHRQNRRETDQFVFGIPSPAKWYTLTGDLFVWAAPSLKRLSSGRQCNPGWRQPHILGTIEKDLVALGITLH